jgi:flagellar export protein FliJ
VALKDLHTLIRIRKWDVDEKQREVAALMRREEDILANQVALAEEMRNELALAAKTNPTERYTLVPYLDRCEERKQVMEALLAEVRRQIDGAREELSDAYRRLKTFEVTQEAREANEDAEETRLEQMDLDEMGLTLHRRKQA